MTDQFGKLVLWQETLTCTVRLVEPNLWDDLYLAILMCDVKHSPDQFEGIVDGAIRDAFRQTFRCKLTGRVGGDLRHRDAGFLFALVTVELVQRFKAIDEFA